MDRKRVTKLAIAAFVVISCIVAAIILVDHASDKRVDRYFERAMRGDVSLCPEIFDRSPIISSDTSDKTDGSGQVAGGSTSGLSDIDDDTLTLAAICLASRRMPPGMRFESAIAYFDELAGRGIYPIREGNAFFIELRPDSPDFDSALELLHKSAWVLMRDLNAKAGWKYWLRPSNWKFVFRDTEFDSVRRSLKWERLNETRVAIADLLLDSRNSARDPRRAVDQLTSAFRDCELRESSNRLCRLIVHTEGEDTPLESAVCVNAVVHGLSVETALSLARFELASNSTSEDSRLNAVKWLVLPRSSSFTQDERVGAFVARYLPQPSPEEIENARTEASTAQELARESSKYTTYIGCIGDREDRLLGSGK